jgi:hypothetical protein
VVTDTAPDLRRRTAKVVHIKPISVFDVSQTDPLTERAAA